MALDHGASDKDAGKVGNFTYPNGTVAILNESIGLTKSAALDYAMKNIRINAVAPGAIRTDIILQQMDFGTYDEKMAIEMFPMKRMGNTILHFVNLAASSNGTFRISTIITVLVTIVYHYPSKG
jgi:NAD(P)-dependent dehydrogenase (short-subunit alcohol dehydrogenase family)